MIKIRTEVKQRMENNGKTARLSRGFEKVYQTSKPQAGLRETTTIRNDRGDITVDASEIKSVVRVHCE